MGVPKFYRWISERYPCLSEVIQEYQIPEFDNLYLDMNGIIHGCSHPNDEDATFRITEEQIFKDIFRYIDTLFRIVRPKRTFFMAIDGVAPRAKMNQQRARRFMSARNAQDLEDEAIRKGQTLPTEDRFDSNCITPGTSFMVRLHEQLQYFVRERITNDENWQNIRIILSGHNCPGEGEHKIMDFIRHERSQPNYDPNTRHCLYGLDADLLMLGLCSHEPHFSLLREEVKFLRPGADTKNKNKTANPEQITFHLLHLSLLREYLELEFLSVKDKVPFRFDLESIIDDWVLMGFLVGNDFIPNLPHMHIHDGALPVLYKTYIDVLPTLGGYINEQGNLNLARFEKFLAKLSEHDKSSFTTAMEDEQWMESKRGNLDEYGVPEGDFDFSQEESDEDEETETDNDGRTKNRFSHLPREKRPAFDTSSSESEDDVATAKSKQTTRSDTRRGSSDSADGGKKSSEKETLTASSASSSSSDSPIMTAAEALAKGLIGGGGTEKTATDKGTKTAKKESLAAAGTSAHMDNIDSCMGFYNSDDEMEGEQELFSDVKYIWSEVINRKFKDHKRNYYKEKMKYGNITKEELREQAIGYVKAIQWNLHYYYHGCCSWSWFYPHHYAPYLSDVKDFSDLKLEFDLNRPFLPFQQLMGVLPAGSRTMLPKPYQELMINGESPVIDFYPTDFSTDLNGKKNDWEAVVLIKFIEEDRLLAALASKQSQLTEEERLRNSHGPHLEFTTAMTPSDEPFPSSLPEVFPPIYRNLAVCQTIPQDAFCIARSEIVKGLLPGVKLDVYFPGFPTMKHLRYRGSLQKGNVKVFQANSRNHNMMLHIERRDEYNTGDDHKEVQALASLLINKEVHVEWPFLQLAKVFQLTTRMHIFERDAKTGEIFVKESSASQQTEWTRQMNNCRDFNLMRRGLVLPGGREGMPVMAAVRLLNGRRIVSSPVGQLHVEKQWSAVTTLAPLDLLVEDVLEAESSESAESRTMTFQEAFPFDCQVFLLLDPAQHNDKYGCVARIKCRGIGDSGEKAGLVVVEAETRLEPDLSAIRGSVSGMGLRWYTAQSLAHRLGVGSHFLSRITGTVFLVEGKEKKKDSRESKLNIGLNLKSSRNNLEVPDYTKKPDDMWLYSAKVGELLIDYGEKFPEIFEYMMEVSSGDDVYYAHEIWEHNTSKKVEELKVFLKALPSASIERQSCNSESVDVRVLSAVERLIDDVNTVTDEQQQQQPNVKKRQIRTKRLAVKIAYLYRPRLNKGNTKPDPEADFRVLDRVVSVKDGTAVPLGLRGTVIAIHPGKSSGDMKLDVMFDREFLGAVKMRSEQKRCYRVPAFGVINLTYGDRCAAGGDKRKQHNSMFTQYHRSQSESHQAFYGSSYPALYSTAVASRGPNQAESHKPPRHQRPNNNRGRYQEKDVRPQTTIATRSAPVDDSAAAGFGRPPQHLMNMPQTQSVQSHSRQAPTNIDHQFARAHDRVRLRGGANMSQEQGQHQAAPSREWYNQTTNQMGEVQWPQAQTQADTTMNWRVNAVPTDVVQQLQQATVPAAVPTSRSVMNEIMSSFAPALNQSDEMRIAMNLKSQLNIGPASPTQQPSNPPPQQQHQQQQQPFTNQPPLATEFNQLPPQQLFNHPPPLTHPAWMFMSPPQTWGPQNIPQYQQGAYGVGPQPCTMGYEGQILQYGQQPPDRQNRLNQINPPTQNYRQPMRRQTAPSSQSHSLFVPLQVTKKQEPPAYAKMAIEAHNAGVAALKDSRQQTAATSKENEGRVKKNPHSTVVSNQPALSHQESVPQQTNSGDKTPAAAVAAPKPRTSKKKRIAIKFNNQ